MPSSQAIEPRRPRSAHNVSVSIAEGSQNNGRRFQLEVSECVETKTVTTTTRLTRKFPRVFVRDPTPLENLDAKEYPLAMKPTPPELLGFSYNVVDEDVVKARDFDDEDEIAAVPDALARPYSAASVRPYTPCLKCTGLNPYNG